MLYCYVLFYICYIYLLEILKQLYTGLCEQSNVLLTIIHFTINVYKLDRIVMTRVLIVMHSYLFVLECFPIYKCVL